MERILERPDKEERANRLPENDREEDREHFPRILDENAPVKEHPDRDEEEHGKGVLERERLRRGAVRKAALLHDHAGEEGAKREGDVEDFRRTVRNAHGAREHEEREELARTGLRDLRHGPREHAASR